MLVTSESSARGCPSGYTLIEMLVVLLLLGLSAALAIPSLRSPTSSRSALTELVDRARWMSVERGEVVYLRVEADGRWSVEPGSVVDGAGLEGVRQGPLARGTIAYAANVPTTLRITPVGSCAPDVRTAARGSSLTIYLPDCRVEPR